MPSETMQRSVRVVPTSDPGSTTQPGNLYIVAVGVGQYPQNSLQLHYPAKDARDFAATLKTQEGRLFRSVIARVLCDHEARRRHVLEAVDWLRQKSTEQDMAMLFLAGHGCNHLPTGNYYFLPWDVEPESLVATAVAGYELREQIAHIRGKRLIFMDTCRSGNVFADGQVLRLRGEFGGDTSPFIHELQQANNAVVVFTSSTGQQPSAESDRWGNGAFTKALVEGLRGQASDSNGQVVTLNRLATYVGRRVPELTQGLQTPTTAILDTVADFPLSIGPFAPEPEASVEDQIEGPARLQRPPAPPDGAYEPEFYVHRQREEKAALNRLRRPGSAVVLQGPWLFGKDDLLSYVMSQANLTGEGRVLRLHMGELESEYEEDFQSFDALLQRIARLWLEQVNPGQADKHLSTAWKRPGSEKNKLTWILEKHLLPDAKLLFVALELADRVHGRPYQHDFFALLRGWVECRGEPWTRLRVLVTVSTEPVRLESTDHSSFFAKANPIQLGELTRAQTGQLAQCYGFAATDESLDRLRTLVGGHPYLMRVALYEAATQEIPLSDLEIKPNLFAPHLQRMRGFVEKHNLLPVIAAILNDSHAAIQRDDYYALYSQGLVVEEDTDVFQLRCRLYQDFFRKLCSRR